MRRRLRLDRLLMLTPLTALVTALPALAQQPPALTPDQQARLQIRPVAEGLYLLPGFDGSQSGGNVAVRVTGEGVIIVDDKFPYSFGFINEQVRQITSQPIRYVLNTHHHGDHAGSNADFLRSAEVVAHRNARRNMIRNDQPGAPRLVFGADAVVFLGGAEARMYHFGRGHTDGDAIVHFPDLGIVHTGDLFIFGQRLDGSTLAPFWDVANGGSVLEWPATLTRLLALDFHTVIPGHGPLLGKEEIRTFRAKLETVIDRVRGEIARGATRADIAARVDTSDLGWPLAAVRLQEAFDELTSSR